MKPPREAKDLLKVDMIRSTSSVMPKLRKQYLDRHPKTPHRVGIIHHQADAITFLQSGTISGRGGNIALHAEQTIHNQQFTLDLPAG